MKVYVAFYDIDSGDRENWNTFYTPFVMSFDKEDARAKANAEIRKLAVDFVGRDASEEDIADEVSSYHIHFVESEIDL